MIGHDIIKTQDSRNRNEKLNLHVKWHGYKQPEWTAINASLKKNIIVQRYLRHHKLNKWLENQAIEEQPLVKRVRFQPIKKRVRFSTRVNII